MSFSQEMAIETARAIRLRCLELSDKPIRTIVKMLSREFSDINPGTLEDYSRFSLRCSERMWQAYFDMKVGLSVLAQIYSLERPDQDYILDELIKGRIGSSDIRFIKRLRKENGWSIKDCIAKAKGEVLNPQAKHAVKRRNLDLLLTEISVQAARWRAMVSQAIEMVEEEEAKAGIGEAIITKVFLLRELIAEQYECVNARMKRYMKTLKRS